MYRISLYTLLFVVVILLQIFIFDRLTFSIAVSPLIYIAFLTLIPIQTSQLEMLFWSLVLGISADLCMGMAGVNTIATLFTGYIRIYMMNNIFTKEMVAMGGVPTVDKVGAVRFFLYIASMVISISLIFFMVESLNISAWGYALLRFAASGSISLLFVWLISHIFGSFITRKL